MAFKDFKRADTKKEKGSFKKKGGSQMTEYQRDRELAKAKKKKSGRQGFNL